MRTVKSGATQAVRQDRRHRETLEYDNAAADQQKNPQIAKSRVEARHWRNSYGTSPPFRAPLPKGEGKVYSLVAKTAKHDSATLYFLPFRRRWPERADEVLCANFPFKSGLLS